MKRPYKKDHNNAVKKGVCTAIGCIRSGAPIPRGTELDGESINSAKMKLRPGYYALSPPCKQRLKNNLHWVN